LIFYSSEGKETGLLVTIYVSLTLVFWPIMYYVIEERVKNVMEIKFRIMKYLLVCLAFLFVSLALSGISN